MADFLQKPAVANKPLSQRMFEKYDSDGSGFIDVSEFQQMLHDQGIYVQGEALMLAVKEIDRNGDRKITYEEFKKWKQTSAFSNLALDDDALSHRLRIAETFDRFDRDRNGSLEPSELALFHAELTECGLIVGTADALLREIDKDGDGNVQFNELVAYLEGLTFGKVSGESVEQEAAAKSNAKKVATEAVATSRPPEQQVEFTRAAKASRFAAPSGQYTYEQLKGALNDVDPSIKEEYLSASDFSTVFGVDKEAFRALPKWKRDAEKKRLGLF